MRRALPAVALAGCLHVAHPAVAPAPGVTIALYDGADPYAIVDERRPLELDGDELLLDHVLPGAELATLWISVLDDHDISIDGCVRPTLEVDARHHQLVSPMVRCRVHGGRGRHLVRVVYIAPGLDAAISHAIAMTDPDHAAIRSRFVIATPRWNEHAEVVVYAAGDAASEPRELARADVALDGGSAVIALPVRQVAAHLRRIYTGALPSPEVDATTDSWHAESTHDVWVWLELALAELAPGKLAVHVELPGEPVRDVVVEHAVAASTEGLRVPLWTDAALSGVRQRVTSGSDERAEQLSLAVANLGAAPREVWIEEQARPGAHRRLIGAIPEPPTIHGDVLRSIVTVQPRAIAHVRYVVLYECKDGGC